jgi:hypothetical protein
MEQAAQAGTPSVPDRWSRVAFFLLIGYCLMGRSFAYLGIPPWHLFIGELVLAAFLLAGPATSLGAWPKLAPRIAPLKKVAKAYVLLFLYGVFEVVRGIALGHPALTSLRDLAFDYYPLFLLLGIWLGLRRPNFARKCFRVLAWLNAVYGISYVLFLNRVLWLFPGVSDRVTPVAIFGLPEFSFVVLLGLLALEPDLKAVWYLLAANAFVLLGMQVRAEWFGFAVGLVIWGWMTKRLMRIAAGGAVIVVLIILMALVNFKIPGPATRGGGQISARDLVGRAVAPIDPDLAENYTSYYRMDLDTTLWRTVWWLAIWNAVHSSYSSALLGFGYGYPIGDLVPYLQGDFIQTPHDVFFYALAYSGWIGVAIFAVLQAEIVSLLWRAWRRTGRPVGIILWAAMIAFALFTPFFEVPQGAIPFYLFCGLLIAPALRSRSAASTRLLPPAPQPFSPPVGARAAT